MHSQSQIVIGSSPKGLCAEGRTDDLSAILHVIDTAEKVCNNGDKKSHHL